MSEPGTAEPEGYLAEKAKGNIAVLPPHGQFHCQIWVGALLPDDVAPVEQKIKKIVG